MSNTKHTPAPWCENSQGDSEYIYSEVHGAIATIPHSGLHREEHKANAERIVACVNACDGMSTKELAIAFTAPFFKNWSQIHSSLVESNTKLKADLMDSYSLLGQYRYQRDELFKATTEFVRTYGSDHTKEMRAARALIKRHDHSPDPMMQALQQILKDSAELPHIHEIARKALEKGGAL